MINNIPFENFPTLETERLLLRKFRLNDASAILSIRSDEQVMKYMDTEWHKNIPNSENFIAKNLESYEKKEGIFWAIVAKENKEFLGDFAFWKIDKKNSRAEIGYTLKPKFWRKGYMKEAIIAIIGFGFNNLQLHSLEANVNPKNNNSSELLKNIGFRKEAYFRENYFYNGTYLDSEIFSLLETDFKYCI